jgi:hypothetical protein
MFLFLNYFLFLLGFLSFLATLALTSRQVNQLYILKGGKKLGLITEGMFGVEKKFTIGLEQESFKNHIGEIINIPLKVKNHTLHYLIDSENGVIHEPILFEYTVGACIN